MAAIHYATATLQAHVLTGVCLFLCVVLGSARGGEATPPGEEPAMWLATAADLTRHYRTRQWAEAQLLAHTDESRPALLRGLGHARSIVRQVSARLLGTVGHTDDAAEEGLLAVALEVDALTAAQARTALAKLYARQPEAMALERFPVERLHRWFATPGDADPELMPAETVELLCRTESLSLRRSQGAGHPLPPEIEIWLQTLLLSTDPRVRALAVRGLGWGTSPKSFHLLVTQLDSESDPAIRNRVLQSLRRRDLPTDAGATIQRLQTWLAGQAFQGLSAGESSTAVPGPGERKHILEATATLYRFGWIAPAVVFSPFLTDSSAGVRLATVQRINELDDPGMATTLAIALRDPGWRTRLLALAILGRWRTTGALGAIRERLEDEEPRVQAAAFLALHRCGVTGIADTLLEQLESPRLPVLLAMTPVLGTIQESRAVGRLIELTNHSDLELACRALEAIAAIAGEEARQGLAQAQSDPRPEVSALAAQLMAAVPEETP